MKPSKLNFKFKFYYLLLIVLFGCTIKPKPEILTPVERLRVEIDYLIKDENLSSANLGVYIESLNKREVIYHYNENKLFIPASNMKLFTTAVGLLYFSPDFKYKTELFTNGEIKSGILKGDLIIIGSGDPTISTRFSRSPTKVFEDWADSLIKSGIKEIAGDIVADNTYFEDTPLGSGWSWEDETYCFSAQRDAFSFNDNCIEIYVSKGDSIGAHAKVRTEPQTKYLNIINETVTGEPDSVIKISFERVRGANDLIISGVFPVNKKEYSESIAVENPAKYGAFVFGEVLTKKGIIFKGKAYSIDKKQFGFLDSETMKEFNGKFLKMKLASYTSPELDEIINVINKKSQNLYAEQLFLTIGKEYKGAGDAKSASESVKDFLKKIGVNTNEFFMVDGSGLSRYNLVTPKQIVTLLRYIAKHRYFNSFYNSLPIAGVDGTLEIRMRQTPAQNNVRAKTGYVSFARNLSGYITTKDGEVIIFSIMSNHYSTPTKFLDNLQDTICSRLADFSRK